MWPTVGGGLGKIPQICLPPKKILWLAATCLQMRRAVMGEFGTKNDDVLQWPLCHRGLFLLGEGQWSDSEASYSRTKK